MNVLELHKFLMGKEEHYADKYEIMYTLNWSESKTRSMIQAMTRNPQSNYIRVNGGIRYIGHTSSPKES